MLKDAYDILALKIIIQSYIRYDKKNVDNFQKTACFVVAEL